MKKLLSLFAAKRGKIVAGVLTLAVAGEIVLGDIWNSVSPNICFAAETGVEKTVFGPEKVYTEGDYEFSIRADYDATITLAELIVINGEMGSDLNRVQSAIITLNGTTVLDSADISEAVDRIEVPVRLRQQANELSAEITSGIPGSFLTIQIDYEIGPAGPLFSGPRQYPFVCETEDSGLGQPLVDNEGQGIPVDVTGTIIGYSKDCIIPTRVDYYYRTTGGSFELLDDPTDRPADLARTRTSESLTVDYIVRVEIGTINRFLYGIAMLAPENEDEVQEADVLGFPWDLSAWNNKLIYYFGGGISIGHSQGRLKLPLNHDTLSLGFAVVYSTGTDTAFHYNLLLGGETALMVKDHFVNRYGEPEYTISTGISGGGIQSYVYAQNWPGLLDAIVPIVSYPDMDTQIIPLADCNLLEYYFDVVAPGQEDYDCQFGGSICGASGASTSQEARKLIEGMNSTISSTECVAAWRPYMPLVANPFEHDFKDKDLEKQYPQELVEKVKWTHADDLVNIFGLDDYGYARVTWDNVGVQYGLQALKEGKITIDQFLDINARIGCWKEAHEAVPEDEVGDPWSIRNANIALNEYWVAPRREGNIEAIEAAYESGIIFVGEIDIPIIDLRPYLEPELNMHNSRQSFSARQRIIERRGDADKQLIWMWRGPDDDPYEPPSGYSDIGLKVFLLLDEWLTTGVKPEAAKDKCIFANGTSVTGDDVWAGILDDGGPGTCTAAFPPYTSSRMVAGGDIKGDIFKCHLQTVAEAISKGVYDSTVQPINITDYQERLEQIFPTGVCDYTKGDVGRAEPNMKRLYCQWRMGRPKSLVRTLKDSIQGLPDGAFTGNPAERKEELSEELDIVLDKIDSVDYQGAISTLSSTIRPRMDGCVGGDSEDDWITDCPVQNKLIKVIDEIIAKLNTLDEFCTDVYPNVWYVDDTPPAGGGRSWDDAFNNIQDAVNAASPGDSIWVAEGIYTSGSTTAVLTMKEGVKIYGGFTGTENFLYERGDPADYPTILDGEGNDHVVVGASNARLDGFIVTGGNANGGGNDDDGGGILNESVADLVVAKCTFKDNLANEDGGGMHNTNSSLKITNCVFDNNSATDNGGGIFNVESSPEIINCTFSDNSADDEGGGMFNDQSSPTIKNCIFTGNSAGYYGGGILNYDDSSPEIINCTFSDNSADDEGGGMFNDQSSPTIKNCIFTGNSATSSGGGMSNVVSSPTITNCAFSGNSVRGGQGNYGGGMYNDNSSPTIINSIFVDNSVSGRGGACMAAFNYGGGMYNYNNSSPTIINCTFSGNSASGSPNILGGGMYNYGSSPTITNCIMWGDSPGEIYNNSSSPTVTYSDIEGGYPGEGNIGGNPLFVRYPDLHLHARSPCIDTGTETGAPSYDLDGKPRPSDEGYDMGAYEFHSVVAQWYVDADATGNNDGTSWADAFTVIQNAVAAASSGDMIWVAEGTYTSDNPTSSVLTMKDGVVIYGGFKGDEIDLSERITPTHYPTTLDGEDRSYPVVVGASNARLDGFIVTGGNANGGGSYRDGGGMFNESVTNLVVANCTFSGNSAVRGGGGMYNMNSLLITITNCLFSGDSAVRGGGIYNRNVSPLITNCLFSGDSATYGGGIYNRDSSPLITNCTFSGNSATYGGGGIYNRDSSPLITNCILWGNTAEIYNDSDSFPFVTYSNVEGGYSGEGNINDAPLFVPGSNGNYYLSHLETHGASSPCIDAGSDTAINIGLGDRTTRTDGVKDTNIVDMGYHYDPLDTMRPCEASPPAGKYCYPGVSVTLSCDDPEATIYYTLDGSEPSPESSVYTAPINISEDTVLKFMAVDAYGNQSSTVIKVYDIDLEAPTGLAALPPTGGYCSPAVSVTLSCDDPEATIYYTLDGSEPTTASLVYTGPIDTSEGATVKFMAVDACGNQSETVTEVYDIDTEAPTGLAATPAGGSYCITTVSLTASDGTIYFTIDGSEPTTESRVYTGPGDVTMSITLKFMAVDVCGNQSSIVTEVYDIDAEAVVSIAEPVDGVTVYAGDVVVSGTADTDISIITVTSDQGHSESSVVDWDGDWSVALLAVNVPSIVITAQGVDSCGNIGSDSVAVPVIHQVWYVDADAPSNGDGTSWETAFTIVPEAAEAASSGDWIWVAEGTYYGPIVWPPFGDEPVLTMKDGVEVYGGFVGIETNLSERGDPANHPTILDGEDESCHVVVGASNARLDGFIVTGGNANGGGSDDDGGGMFNESVTDLVVTNCTFSGNSADDDGGGMHNTDSSLTITNCVFNFNSAMGNGGGIFNEDSSPEITHCIFSGNSADDEGGGMFNWWVSSPTIKNCIFTGNSAGYNGGGMCNYYYSSPEIINCTFSDNSANEGGDGIYNFSQSSPTISNCIVWDDRIYSFGASFPTVTYSDVEGGYDGEGNIDEDPLFVTGPGGAYYLSQPPDQVSTSPCVDAGSDTAVNLGLDDKTTRTDGLTDTDIVDMGYHYITSRWAFFVAGAVNGNVYVFRSRRDGTFAEQIVGNVGAPCRGSAIADFDNDGDLDFIIQDHIGRSHLFINTSGLTMRFLHKIVAEGLFLHHWFGNEAATADFNNDGYYDYIVPSSKGYLYLFLNTGQNTFSQSIVNAEWLGSDFFAGMDAGDFNEDGNMDFLVVGYDSGYVYLYSGNGNGTFTYNLAFSGQGVDTQAAVVGDFDSDGHLDAIVGQDDDSDPGQTWLYVGDGAGNFSYWGEAYDTNLSSEAGTDEPGAGFADAYDFDEDGILDIVAGAESMLLFKGIGDGTFEPSVQIYSFISRGVSTPPIP